MVNNINILVYYYMCIGILKVIFCIQLLDYGVEEVVFFGIIGKFFIFKEIK